MSPRPHDGPAEEGLSAAFLGIVQDDRKVAALRSLLSGFCHRCRNSLNGIKLSLYLFRREARASVPPCWGDLEADYLQVERLFDALQTIYRPMTIAMVRLNLGAYLEEQLPRWRSMFESHGQSIRLVEPESPVVAELDPVQLGVALDAIATWRAGSGRTGTMTRVTWRAGAGGVELGWEETLAEAGGSFERRARRHLPRWATGRPSRRLAGAADPGAGGRHAWRPPPVHRRSSAVGPGPLASVPAGERAACREA